MVSDSAEAIDAFKFDARGHIKSTDTVRSNDAGWRSDTVGNPGFNAISRGGFTG